MKRFFNNDIIVRAFKTFIQAFLSSLVVFINSNATLDKTMIKSAIIGAVASGMSACMNYVIQLLDKGGNNNE